ncbi:L-cysteine:1D-myo-inositol 2-amino-2-deoxy-alpha-D-glucopyranoside ligase [Pilimelia anulata]|uniref:L-cysteine:1D-myo-inositol 2-amino-2-deoxy-alpha-D-glucopyranoside ligase n=1 Tax=Pilimelia anulata TaxID=53371 RepID=A0A8J3B921_9ACTN|nr:cysteine--1-D-myo-inosityl 2-amino-2-deoxy-alpha-D-glucopyranoside ligase [Pilimelia anulata]GGK02104.1 L-cysteine:1D-myo-inositol 2-amino-2-deoxy-alpha-D-glucopyranoside ligase [Pilimelia anulata]
MESWSGPEVPRLPGTGQPLALFDSARRAIHPTGSGPATMYVCGITPYDAAHLGHAATMITFDLVQRSWRDAGRDVAYVQNVTDIDDPLLERAARDGEEWEALAERETAVFRKEMGALRLIPPDHYIGAVESIPVIAERTAELLARGAAYRLDDGTNDMYFDLTAAPHFGYESHLSRDQMLTFSAERGGDPQRPGKRDPLDPLLWRGARAGEPSWPGGVLGDGRPGWHIECAVIALELLGDTVTVQGGGNDLLFPHHECSAAHAETLTGARPFAGHYVHAGMIGLNGDKMSKSQGNLVFVGTLLADDVPPMALRLALLADHYRADRQWTDDLLKIARARLHRWREAARAAAGPSGAELLAGLRGRLAEDLDTPGALSLLDWWAEAAVAGSGDDPDAPALVRNAIDALLGVELDVSRA